MLGAIFALLAAAEAHSAAGYRSVVVFGDTQDLVDGPVPDSGNRLEHRRSGDAEEYAYFVRMIDWVLNNRERENIDFVLHVGDAIQHGPPLPLAAKCVVDGECREIDECHCRGFNAVPVEWARFDAQWKRLDGQVPYAIVRGNHDNRGTSDASNPGYRKGFAQHYGTEQVRDLPGYYTSYPGSDDTAHAWMFELGGQPVLVVGMSHRPGLAQVAWARGLLNDPQLARVPAIMLSHQFFLGLPIRYDKPTPQWDVVVDNAQRILMAVWGHIAPGQVAMVDVRGYETLRIRTNWQGSESRLLSLFTVVRFYGGREGVREVEVVAFSPVFGKLSWPQTRLSRRPFTLRPRAMPARRAQPYGE
jgi:predicted phosphodiesterase